MNNWRFGIVTDCFGGKIPIEKAIELLSEIGFSDLEIAGGQLVKDMQKPPLPGRIAKRVKSLSKQLTDSGMTAWQFHGPYGSCDLVAGSEKTRLKNVDAYKRWIDIAEAVAARNLIIHIGGRNDLCPGKEPEEIFEKNAASLSALAGYSKNMTVKLAIENLVSGNIDLPDVFNRVGYRISDLKKLIDMVASDKLVICLDTGHANVSNLDIVSAVKECGRLLAATHIQESNHLYDMHMFPFSLRQSKSGMDWFRIFDAFKTIKYPYPLIGECANTSGELPPEMVRFYLKAQKELIEMAMSLRHRK